MIIILNSDMTFIDSSYEAGTLAEVLNGKAFAEIQEREKRNDLLRAKNLYTSRNELGVFAKLGKQWRWVPEKNFTVSPENPETIQSA